MRKNLTNCQLTSRMRKRRGSGMIAGHSVDTATRGSGCSAEIKIGPDVRDRVGCGTEEEVSDIHSAPSKSPPIQFGFHRSSTAGEEMDRAKMQSRKFGAKRAIWRSIDSVQSFALALGTWQEAQAVCWPIGARLGSKSDG